MSVLRVIGLYVCCPRALLMPTRPPRTALYVQGVLRRDYDLMTD
jgi:hypothetical protein